MARPSKGDDARTIPMTMKVNIGQKKAIRDFCKAFGSGVFFGIVMTCIKEYTETHSDKQSPLT